jgi:peptidyl-tRNA hydrolase, PTH2 family
MSIKQVIVVRKDLNMRKGKMIAQGAHASMKVLLDKGCISSTGIFTLQLDGPWRSWVEGIFTKVVVSVDSQEALLRIKSEAEAVGLPAALIEDCGATEFHGVKTPTAVAVGPAEGTLIDRITGHLPLL